MEDRNNPENQALATMQGIQASMWDTMAEDADGDGMIDENYTNAGNVYYDSATGNYYLVEE